MSYLVLARKFRPQTFGSVVGQEHVTKAIANAILRDRVPHAFLFCGPRGVGKTTTSRVLAKALNCTGRPIPKEGDIPADTKNWSVIEPCGECVNCKEISAASSLAVWEIDGASNNSVDNVRELIDSLRSMPPRGSTYKIYIIDEVHMLSVAAFNALLKSLEEPPPHTVFVFATTEPHKIPETVISRCQRYNFHRISSGVIAKSLMDIAETEKVEVDPRVCSFVARKADGGMRDAQSMFDRLLSFASGKLDLETAQQLLGAVDKGAFFRLSKVILTSQPQECFAIIDEFFSHSLDLKNFISDFLRHWRTLLLVSLSKAQLEGEQRKKQLANILQVDIEDIDESLELVAEVESFDIQRLFDLAEQTADKALQSNFPRYVLEAGIAKMATLPDLKPLPSIITELKSIAGGAPSLGSGTHAIASQPAPLPQAKPTPVALPKPQETEVLPAQPVIEPAPEEPVAEPVVTRSSFTPEWGAFLQHVKQQKALMVEAYLKRVSPQVFVLGKLVLEAKPYDIQMLSDKETLATLRSCVCSYSQHSSWELRFVEHAGGNTTNGATHVPGSVQERVTQEQEAANKRVIQEAKTSPAVQHALSIFEGSRIAEVISLSADR